LVFLLIPLLASQLHAMQEKGDFGLEGLDAQNLLKFAKDQEKQRTSGDYAKYDTTCSPDVMTASHQSLLAIQYGKQPGLRALKTEWASIELKAQPQIENLTLQLFPTTAAQPQIGVFSYDYIFTMPAQQQPERLLFNMVFVQVEGGQWKLAFFNEAYR
jgi:hypothetical protein